VEGAEDDATAGDAQMRDHVRAADAVVGISASGGAAFVVAALERARTIGAFTLAITSVDASALADAADEAIVVPTGAEVLAGSTRLKAGTAQKIALNALSTAVMVRLGKVHDNLMVDVVATSEKLRARALRLVCELTDSDAERARAALDASGGRVKVAVTMLLKRIDKDAAAALLEAHGDRLRDALENVPSG
jgi:N-acetylmuramic acid 6-phosphate etherase